MNLPQESLDVNTNLPKLLKSREAAELLSVSERTLFTMKDRGEIPHMRIRKRCIRYHLTDVQEYLNRAKQGGVAS